MYDLSFLLVCQLVKKIIEGFWNEFEVLGLGQPVLSRLSVNQVNVVRLQKFHQLQALLKWYGLVLNSMNYPSWKNNRTSIFLFNTLIQQIIAIFNYFIFKSIVQSCSCSFLTSLKLHGLLGYSNLWNELKTKRLRKTRSNKK